MGGGAPTSNRSPPASRPGGDAAPQLGGLFAGGMPKLRSANTNSGNWRLILDSGSDRPVIVPPRNEAPPPAPRNRTNSNASPPVVVRGGPSIPIPPSRASMQPPPRPGPSVPQSRPPPVAPRNDPPPVAPRNDPPPVFSRQEPPAVIPRNEPTSRQAPPPPPARHSPHSSPRNSISHIAQPSSSSLGSRPSVTPTIQDGRWTFRTDIPLPRQFPSGEPALLKARPAPPPPVSSRLSVKRPPAVPPPR